MNKSNCQTLLLLLATVSLSACGGGSAGAASFSATPSAASGQTFSIGGTVGGLIAGQQLTLINNSNGDTITPTGNGQYTFPTTLAGGSNFAVSVQVQPTPETCNVANASGTLNASNVTNINVNCALPSWTAGWTNLTNTQTNGHINATNFGIYAPLNQFNLMTIDEQNNLAFEFRGQKDDIGMFNPYSGLSPSVYPYDQLPGSDGPMTLTAHYLGPNSEQFFLGTDSIDGGLLYQLNTSDGSISIVNNDNGTHLPSASTFYNGTLWWADSIGNGYFGADKGVDLLSWENAATNMVFDSNGNLYMAFVAAPNAQLLVCPAGPEPFSNCKQVDSGGSSDATIISSLVADESGNVFALWNDAYGAQDGTYDLHVIKYQFSNATNQIQATGIYTATNIGPVAYQCVSSVFSNNWLGNGIGFLAYNHATGNLILIYPGSNIIVLNEEGTEVNNSIPALPSNTYSNPVCALAVDSNGMIYINQTYLVNPPNQFNSDIYYYLNNQ